MIQDGWTPLPNLEKDYPRGNVELIDDKGFTASPAHWACDLSGEEQPAFKGWFIPTGEKYGYDYEEVVIKPIAYRVIDAAGRGEGVKKCDEEQ